MKQAFSDSFQEGLESVLLIGSDIPHLSSDILTHYFDMLADYPMVIGPAHDGGYYLIGFQRRGFAAQVFRGIEWSTEKVLVETIEKARKAGTEVYQGPVFSDIDTLEDLESLLGQDGVKEKIPHLWAIFKSWKV